MLEEKIFVEFFNVLNLKIFSKQNFPGDLLEGIRYLPTTEAAGIRLLVHDQTQQPFPDTFGYSAPTGKISSFGLKSKALQRLGAPYGKCLANGKTADYIYAEEYSTEVKNSESFIFQNLIRDFFLFENFIQNFIRRF